MEKTLILLKPDAVERFLIWDIIKRFEKKSFKIIWMKMMNLSSEIIDEHYDFLIDKPFFSKLKKYMMSWPVVAIVILGENSIKIIRDLVWATNPLEANPWTIRWDFAINIDANIIHASDSIENSEKEIKRFFEEKEILL